jgi:hypothetical protein
VPAEECCAFKADGANPEGFWVTTLLPGQTYDFDLMPGSPLPTGGEWGADHGTIDQDGVFRAPSYAPPSGLVEVSYDVPGGARATVWVRLEEAPGHPFEQPHTVPDGFFDEADYRTPGGPPPPDGRPLQLQNPPPSQEKRDSWGRAQWARRDWLDNVHGDGKWHELRRSTDPEDPDLSPLSECADIVAAESGGLLPASTYVGTVERLDMIGIQPDSPGIQQRNPRRCKTGPLYALPPWKGQPCSPPGKTRTVDGPRKQFEREGPVIPDAGEIEVTAAIRAEIGRLFGVDLTIGAKYKFSRQLIYYKGQFHRDGYACIDGIWQYVRSETCERLGFGERTMPRWVAHLDGYAPDGAPDWMPWNCNAVP